MQEVKVAKDLSGLKIFINGIPQLELITQDQLTVMVNALEKQIDKHFENKNKCKSIPRTVK